MKIIGAYVNHYINQFDNFPSIYYVKILVSRQNIFNPSVKTVQTYLILYTSERMITPFIYSF